MNEKQNRFIVSVAAKNVLVFFCFVFLLFIYFFYYLKKYPGHVLNLFTVVSYRG